VPLIGTIALYFCTMNKRKQNMGLQDRLAAARVAILRQYEQVSGEQMNEKDCVIDDKVLDFIVEFDLSIA